MTATSTTTVTDRYVNALLNRLPVKQRADIDQELRASIADAMEDHIEAGKDPTEAERAALTELGDPARLAARYTDRPLQLIGPALYLDYIRLLTALLAIVVPVVMGVVGFGHVGRGGDFGTALGDTLGVGITTAVHIFCWTTLLYVFIERAPGLRPATARQWTPDALPEPPIRRSNRSVMTQQIIMAVLFLALILLSRLQGALLYAMLVVVAAGIAGAVVQTYLRWSVPAAIIRWLLTVTSAATFGWVVVYRSLGPVIDLAPGVSPEAVRWTYLGLIIAAAIVTVMGTASAAASFVTKSWQTPDWKALTRNLVDGLVIRPRRSKT